MAIIGKQSCASVRIAIIAIIAIIGNHDKQSCASVGTYAMPIRDTQRQSGTLRGNQGHSEAIISHERHSLVGTYATSTQL